MKTIQLTTEATYKATTGEIVSLQRRWMHGAHEHAHFIKIGDGEWGRYEHKLPLKYGGIGIAEALTEDLVLHSSGMLDYGDS